MTEELRKDQGKPDPMGCSLVSHELYQTLQKTSMEGFHLPPELTHQLLPDSLHAKV